MIKLNGASKSLLTNSKLTACGTELLSHVCCESLPSAVHFIQQIHPFHRRSLEQKSFGVA